MKKGYLFAVLIIFVCLSYISANNQNYAGIGIDVNISNSSNGYYRDSGSRNVEIRNFIPKEFKSGDVQFNIQIYNKQNNSLSNVIAFVTGEGYSTYDVFPIENLGSGEKDYVFVNGNFKKTGNITLTIWIEGDIFYQDVRVISDSDLDEKQKAEEQRKEILLNLSDTLGDLEQNYNALEDELSSKSDNNYDVSRINLDDLKRILRDTQLNILTENIGEARINLNLAQQEYNDQKNNLGRTSKIPFIQRTKDYAVLFSAIAGALIMFFTLSEMLRRRGESVFSTVGRIVKTKDREVVKVKRKRY